MMLTEQREFYENENVYRRSCLIFVYLQPYRQAAQKPTIVLVHGAFEDAAYLPQDGDSLVSMAQKDADAKIGPHLQIQKEKGIASIEYSSRADLFANGGPEALRKAIPDLILDEPLAPLATPVKVTSANFGKVDKVYIHTAFDQVISPAFQAQMVANTPVRAQYTLQTRHTPFLTDPNGLADAIERAAK
jgi:hypothetical protein